MNRGKIPAYFIKKVLDTVGENAIELTKKFLKRDIEEIIEEIARDNLFEKEAKEVRTYVFRSKYQRLKNRWYNAIIKQVEEPNKTNKKTEILLEIEKIKAFDNEEERKAILNKVYNVENFEELIELRKNEILEWKENPDAKITEYRYIQDKTKKQIENAIEIDLTLTICNILIDEFNGDLRNIIIGEPEFMVNHPVKSERRGRLKLSEDVLIIDNKEYKYEAYQVESNPNYKFLSLYDDSILSNPSISSRNLKTLDKYDRRLVLAVLKHQTMDFARDKKIYVDIHDLAREVYESDNGSRYDMIVSKLIKLSLIRFATLENDVLSVFGIFDNVEIDLANRGRKAEITVNEKVHQQVLDDKMIRIYGDKFKQLELEVSENIVSFLQFNRWKWHLSGFDEKHCILTYDSFLYKMRFDSRRRKSEIIKLIEESLQEFVDKEFIIQSFKRRGDLFYITYISVEDYELIDLFIPSTKVDIPELSELKVDLTLP